MWQKHVIKILVAISFLDLCAVGLTFPLLSPHLRSLGASHLVVGLISAAYSALQVISGPVIGSWSDLRGRKFVLISTLCLSSLCYFLLGISSSLFAIFLLRALLGIVKHTQTLLKSIVGDILPKDQHSHVFGLCSALGALGFVVGPVIGGHLSEISHGFFYVCLITAFLFVLNIGFVLSIPDELLRSKGQDSQSHFDFIKNLHSELTKAASELSKINWSLYWDAFALRFLFGFVVNTYFFNLSLYVKERYNLSQKLIGYTISFYSIIGSVSAFLLGTITRTFYKDDLLGAKRLYHGFVVMGISLICLHFAPNLLIFLLFMIPFAIASIILRLVSMECLLNKCLDGERGSLSGASNSVMSISRFISPITSGVVEDVFGQNTVILAAFLPSIIGMVLSRRMYRGIKYANKNE